MLKENKNLINRPFYQNIIKKKIYQSFQSIQKQKLNQSIDNKKKQSQEKIKLFTYNNNKSIQHKQSQSISPKSIKFSNHLTTHRKIRQLKKFQQRKLYQEISNHKSKAKRQQAIKQAKNNIHHYRQDIHLAKSIIKNLNNCYNFFQQREKPIFNAYYDQQELQQTIKQNNNLLFRVREKVSSIKSHRQASISGKSQKTEKSQEKSLKSYGDLNLFSTCEDYAGDNMIKSLIFKVPSTNIVPLSIVTQRKKKKHSRSVSEHEYKNSQINILREDNTLKNNINSNITENHKKLTDSITTQIMFPSAESNQIPNFVSQNLCNVKISQVSTKLTNITHNKSIQIDDNKTSEKKKQKNLGDFIRFKKNRLNFQRIR